jgi:hypothetical protein
MRHKGRTMLAALVAVLALGVVASASASAALPEFAPEGGKFPVTLEGSFPGLRGGISSTSNKSVGCEGVYAKGEITGAKTATLAVELRNCENAEKTTCEFGEKGSAVEYFAGSANLVYINKAKKEVGLVLTLKKTKGECFGGAIATIQGSFVIPITPVNAKTSKPVLTITGNGKGVQTVGSYENEKSEVVKTHLEVNWGTGFIMAALETGTLSLTANKALTVEG